MVAVVREGHKAGGLDKTAASLGFSDGGRTRQIKKLRPHVSPAHRVRPAGAHCIFLCEVRDLSASSPYERRPGVAP